MGRRRRAAYATVSVAKQKKTNCGVSKNLATNLRLRTGDKVKVVPLVGETSADTERSGDMILMQCSTPPEVMSVTLSPVEDSLKSLEASEGGDEIAEDEINARFVAPYMEERGGMVKRGHLLTLGDENGKKLEFIVTDVALEGEEEKEEGADGE